LFVAARAGAARQDRHARPDQAGRLWASVV
jgi:hypothetical protein